MSPSHLVRGDVLQVRVPVATVWTDPEAPRAVDSDAVLDSPEVAGWAATMDASTRRGLHGRTLTQVLLAEPVQVLGVHGDWVEVACLDQPASGDHRGYPGWMRRAHLDTPAPPSARTATIIHRSGQIWTPGSKPTHASFGTRLPVLNVTEDRVSVVLPGQTVGEVSVRDVSIDQAKPTQSYRGADVVALAEMFLGLPYLWGGTSAWGLDCSGLVHLVYRALGVTLPRDADDQAACGAITPIPPGEVQPGDLYFFARPGQDIHHVGLASKPFDGTGQRWMLHAPEAGRGIEDGPMTPHHTQTLTLSGRVQSRKT